MYSSFYRVYIGKDMAVFEEMMPEAVNCTLFYMILITVLWKLERLYRWKTGQFQVTFETEYRMYQSNYKVFYPPKQIKSETNKQNC